MTAIQTTILASADALEPQYGPDVAKALRQIVES